MRLFAAWLMAMLALISSAVAEIPYLDYTIDFQSDGNQFHVQSKVRNTPLLRFLPKLGTNSFAGAGYSYVFRFSKDDSADAMASVTGAWNAASGRIEFPVSTNNFARTVKGWYATVVAMSNTIAVSYAKGLITIERSPEIDTPGVLATLTAINGSGYGPFTGSFILWPFPVESGSISQFTGETTSPGLVWQSTTNGVGRWGPAVTATGAVSYISPSNGISGGGDGAVGLQLDTNFVKQLAGVTNEPLFDASPALGITSNNILQWNAAISTNTTGTVSGTTIADGSISTNDLDTNVNGRIAKGVEAWGWGQWSSATFNAGSDLYGPLPNGNIRSNAVGTTELDTNVNARLSEASATFAWGSWSQGIYGAVASDLYLGSNGYPQIRTSAVTTVEILNGTVAAVDMATNVGVSTFLNDSGYLTTSAAQLVFFPTNGALGGDLYGTPTNALIRTNAVGSAEVTDGTLTTDDVVIAQFDARYLNSGGDTSAGPLRVNAQVDVAGGDIIVSNGISTSTKYGWGVFVDATNSGDYIGFRAFWGTPYANQGPMLWMRHGAINGGIGVSSNANDGTQLSRVNIASGAFYTLWDIGNDGAGSGLDADLLDGNDSTSFVNKAVFDATSNGMVRLASTGTQVIATGVSILSNTTVSAPLVMLGDTNLVNANQLSNGSFTNFSLWSCDTCAFSTSSFLVVFPPTITSDLAYTGTITFVAGQEVRVGFDFINYTAIDEVRTTIGGHTKTNSGYSSGTNRITVTLPTHTTSNLHIAVVAGSTNFAYIDNVTAQVVNATGQTLSVAGDVDAGGNITAAGSLTASSISQASITGKVSETGHTMTGSLTNNGIITVGGNVTMRTRTNGGAVVGSLILFSDGDSNYREIYSPDAWVFKIYDNDSGDTGDVWTTFNDGSGSGLDADLLDGLTSTQFARKVAINGVTNLITGSAGLIDLGSISAPVTAGVNGIIVDVTNTLTGNVDFDDSVEIDPYQNGSNGVSWAINSGSIASSKLASAVISWIGGKGDFLASGAVPMTGPLSMRTGIMNLGTNAYAFGDSVMDGGAYSIPVSSSIWNYVINNKGWYVTNLAVSGGEIADFIPKVYATTVVAADSSFALLGYNDMRHRGTNARDVSDFKNAALSMCAWLSMPQSAIVLGQSSSVTNVGTWTNSTHYGGAMGKCSSNEGDGVYFRLRGPIVYLNVLMAGRGMTVLVDGTNYGTVVTGSYTAANSGTNVAPQLIRVGGLASGWHNIALTVAAGSGNAHFLWAASPRGSITKLSPSVFVGNCLDMTTAGYAAGGAGWTNGSDAAVNLYNEALSDVARILAGDGLNVAYVDANARWNASTMISGDTVHPNAAGYAAIGESFLAEMNSAVRFTGRGLDPSGTFHPDILQVGTGRTVRSLDEIVTSAGATNLYDLNLVDAVTPSANQVVKWNGSVWTNAADATSAGETNTGPVASFPIYNRTDWTGQWAIVESADTFGQTMTLTAWEFRLDGGTQTVDLLDFATTGAYTTNTAALLVVGYTSVVPSVTTLAAGHRLGVKLYDGASWTNRLIGGVKGKP